MDIYGAPGGTYGALGGTYGALLPVGGCLTWVLTTDILTGALSVTHGTLTATITTCEETAVAGSYPQGQPVTVTLTAKNTVGALADPATLTVQIELPDCSVIEPDIDHPSTGVYSFDVETPQAGVYKWRAVAAGGVEAVAEGQVLVRAALFTAVEVV